MFLPRINYQKTLHLITAESLVTFKQQRSKNHKSPALIQCVLFCTSSGIMHICKHANIKDKNKNQSFRDDQNFFFFSGDTTLFNMVQYVIN